MNKKGIELTFNTIIIAAICLIVLVVVIAIFTNIMGTSIKEIIGIKSCENQAGGKGYCSDSCKSDETGIFHYGGCSGAEPYCCIPKK